MGITSIPLTANRSDIAAAIDSWLAAGCPGLAAGRPALTVECNTTVGAVRPGQALLTDQLDMVVRGITPTVRVGDGRLPGDDGEVTVIRLSDGMETSIPADMPCRVVSH